MQTAGALQMAIDEWLLEQHRQGKQPSILRFYTWEPIALSLGYHQRQVPAHWHHLVWQGQPVQMVRRPSGGRAVLHQGDLTYALITSDLPTSRIQTYQRLCEFLIQGWRSLGVELHYGQTGRGYIHQPNCFGSATAADLVMANGTKLIGSAQLRRGNAILQHGSMRLFPDSSLYQQVFSQSAAPPQFPWQLAPLAVLETVMDALIAAARRCLDIPWEIQPLSASEWTAIHAQAELSPAVCPGSILGERLDFLPPLKV